MKKILLTIVCAALCTIAIAQNNEKKPVIRFDSITIDAGTFSADTAIIQYKFVYKNIGDAPLYIHKVTTACGCTAANFSTEPLMPGKKDTIHVTYDGTKKYPGKMRRSITVHNNSAKEIVRLYIKGNMLPAEITEVPDAEPVE